MQVKKVSRVNLREMSTTLVEVDDETSSLDESDESDAESVENVTDNPEAVKFELTEEDTKMLLAQVQSKQSRDHCSCAFNFQR